MRIESKHLQLIDEAAEKKLSISICLMEIEFLCSNFHEFIAEKDFDYAFKKSLFDEMMRGNNNF
jgi:hypothetical protein